MARLLEAVRPDARLILVGDPEQLASVEAGAVLGDIVGPAARGLCMGQAARAQLPEATGHPVPDTGDEGALPASATGSWSCAMSAATVAPSPASPGPSRRETRTPPWPSSRPRIPTWIGSPLDPSDAATAEQLDLIRRRVAVESGRLVIEAARAGDASTALDALERLPPPVRPPEGTRGRGAWTGHIERWLRDGSRRVHRAGRLVRRAPADRHGERLRARPLQRRHRRRGEGRRPADGGRLRPGRHGRRRSAPRGWPRWTPCTP